jgi:hypothetical protein
MIDEMSYTLTPHVLLDKTIKHVDPIVLYILQNLVSLCLHKIY